MTGATRRSPRAKTASGAVAAQRVATRTLMATIDAMQDAICYFDADDRLVLHNRATHRIYAGLEDLIVPGVRFEELLDAALHRGLWDTEGLPAHEWKRLILDERRRTSASQSTLRFTDGRWIMRREIRSEDGGRIGICTDITEFKEHEENIERSRAEAQSVHRRLQSAVDALDNGFAIWSEEGRLVICNEAYRAQHGYLPQIRAGLPIDELAIISETVGVATGADDGIRRMADGRWVVRQMKETRHGDRVEIATDVSDLKRREDELAEANELSRLAEATVNAVHDPIFVKDSELRFVFVNQAFARLFGRTPQEVIGRRAGDLVSDAEATPFEASERYVLETGNTYEAEESFEQDGAPKSRIVRKNRVRTASGRDYVCCFLFDITDQRRREVETEQARKRLAAILDALPAGVVIYDADDHFVHANREIFETLPAIAPILRPGTPLRRVLEAAHEAGYFRHSGDPSVDILFDSDREAWLDAYIARYHVVNRVSERRTPNGRWYQTYDSRMADGTFIGVRVDITTLKDRENALRESMRQIELFRHVLDELPVAAYVKDETFAIRFVNKAWCDLTGIGKAEAIGSNDRMLFGAEGEPFMARDASVLETGIDDETEEVVTHRQGDRRQLIAKKTRLVSGDGTVYLIGSSEDITELKQRECELREAQKKAVLADRAKSEFLANMSHEIRTPMNGVLGMAELLARSELTPKQKTFTDIIMKSGTALLTIINDILDFSKIDAGQMMLDPAPFDLPEAIEDVVTLVSTRAKEKDLELIVRIQPDLPESLMGDVGRFRQIVTNLVGNAVKFTDRGHVLVDVSGTVSDAGQVSLRVRVEDTGIGIPRDKLQLIFEKFSQVDSSSTRRHEGTGLGLAISARLVELMGGRMGVESTERFGSTFWFEIALPTGTQKEPKQAADLAGSRILIIDDNAVNRAILLEQCRAWHLDAAAANGGEEGLAVLRAAAGRGIAVDCVILDYQMPDMNGTDVIRAIRADATIAATPVVLLTSVDQTFATGRFRELGVDAQLTKPARSAVLFDAIASAIRGRTSAATDDLPADRKATGAPATAPAALLLPPRVAPSDGHRIDILVAEDNEVNQLVFAQILDQTSFVYEIVGNGELAVEACAAMTPRMVLMDVSMPRMNGLEATQAIRRMEAEAGIGGHVPVVGVTAHALKGDRERCIASGMDDYLPKPISPNALLAKVQRWIGGSVPAAETVGAA